MTSNTVNINKDGELVYITFPKLERCGVVRHTFSTRFGGVSDGQYSTMNLSFNNGDKCERVEENYKRLCSAVGIDTAHLVLSKQTHTNNIKTVTREHCGTGYNKPSFSDIDGLVTNQSGVALVTQYADCTPLLFCDPKRRVIATSHAGWRGTALMIGKHTVDRMVEEFGSSPKDIIAAIGPSIGSCCYEIDAPVYNAFMDAGILGENIFFKTDSEHYNLDLKEANRQILVNSGILPENIDVSDICTCCNSGEMHSHRATNGKRGNLAAIIELV